MQIVHEKSEMEGELSVAASQKVTRYEVSLLEKQAFIGMAIRSLVEPAFRTMPSFHR